MGVEVAAVAAIGAAVQYEAGRRAAGAQEDIAKAQLGQQRADRSLAARYAEPTPEELAQLSKSISLNDQDIARKQKLLDSSDPALIEAGKQALNLLRGEEAKSLNPLRQQQAKDRLKLEDNLRARLGSGYANTSAGIQALAAFDEGSQRALFDAQERSLASLLGVAQFSQGAGNLQQNIYMSSALTGQQGAINQRKINAILGTPITASGAEFVGGLQNARNDAQLGGSIISGAGLYAALNAKNPKPESDNNNYRSGGYDSYDDSIAVGGRQVAAPTSSVVPYRYQARGY
jgi:osmotically-inducible protein OsmY